MSRRLRNPGTPFLTVLLLGALVLGAPIALVILFTHWEGSPQRQVAGVIGILTLAMFLLLRRKYEILLLAIIFLSQIQVSLYTIDLAAPAKLQIFLIDIFLFLFLVAGIERKERFRPDRVGWLMIALVAWQGLSTVLSSVHFDRSLVFLLWQTKYLLAYLLVSNMELTEKLANQVKVAVLVAIGVQALLAIGQQVTGGTLGLVVFGEQDPSRLFFVKGDLRVSGTLGATNAFAGYMAMMLVCVLPLLFRRQNLIWYGVQGLGAIALLVTFSRAGWLSFAVGGLLVVVALVRARVVRPTRILAMSILGIGLLGVGISAYFDRVQVRFQDRDAILSAQGRFTQFGEAWPMIQKFPTFGIGPGVTEYFGAWNDNEVYIRPALGGATLGNQPHSSQLQYWIEGGTPAFLLWVVLMLMVFKTAFAKTESVGATPTISLLRIGAACAAAAVMTDASFGTEINSPQISLIFWILLGLARNRVPNQAESTHLGTFQRTGIDWQHPGRPTRLPWMPPR